MLYLPSGAAVVATMNPCQLDQTQRCTWQYTEGISMAALPGQSNERQGVEGLS